jgi:hypothetical protein
MERFDVDSFVAITKKVLVTQSILSQIITSNSIYYICNNDIHGVFRNNIKRV